MSTDLSTRKHVILMKSGVALFVEQATAENLSGALLGASGHSFVKIKELGELINSAEIAAIYTPDKYSDYLRVKAGEHQCSFGIWHKKFQNCECESERRKEREQKMEKIRRDEENRPPSPEERAVAQEWLKKNRELMEQRGLLLKGKKIAYQLKRSALTAYEAKHGTPYEVPHGAVIVEDEQIPI